MSRLTADVLRNLRAAASSGGTPSGLSGSGRVEPPVSYEFFSALTTMAFSVAYLGFFFLPGLP